MFALCPFGIRHRGSKVKARLSHKGVWQPDGNSGLETPKGVAAGTPGPLHGAYKRHLGRGHTLSPGARATSAGEHVPWTTLGASAPPRAGSSITQPHARIRCPQAWSCPSLLLCPSASASAGNGCLHQLCLDGKQRQAESCSALTLCDTPCLSFLTCTERYKSAPSVPQGLHPVL